MINNLNRLIIKLLYIIKNNQAILTKLENYVILKRYNEKRIELANDAVL